MNALQWQPTPYRSGGWFADHGKNRYLVKRVEPRARHWVLRLNGAAIADGKDPDALKAKAEQHASG